MSSECLHWLADWASVLTFFITLFSAIVGVWGYFKYLYERRHKSKKLEVYLKHEKQKKVDHGQRTVVQIIRDVGLTQDEIIQSSFVNPHIVRRVKLDEDGLAEQLLFEYQD